MDKDEIIGWLANRISTAYKWNQKMWRNEDDKGTYMNVIRNKDDRVC